MKLKKNAAAAPNEARETALPAGSGGTPPKRRFRLKRRWIALAAVLVAAGGATSILHQKASANADVSVAYTEAAVSRQSITKSLSSSGTLEPADSYTVNTLVSGEVLSDTFEEGDLVEKDQLLYTLNASDASTGLTQAQNSYSQSQRSYNEAVANKYPSADMSGSVKEVYVKNGDSISAGTELVTIVGDNNLYIDFLFSYVDSSNFYIGQPATLYIDGLEGTVSGTVSAVSGGSNVDGTGRANTTVRVQAVNPGLVSTSHTAQAAIGNYRSYGSSSIHISASSTITASVSGKVSGLDLMPGDTVGEGDRICTITGTGVDDQIENARISLSNASNSVQNANDKLDDYQITAPISGTVVTKTAKAGDKIEGGSTGTLCVIYDLSYLEMTMNIDELDISSVAVGQTVQVTADAVPGRTYSGVVTKLSVAGTTSGGITTYPVTVRIDEADGLLPGMNVDAEIVIGRSENVIAIPSGAVSRGNVVLVSADSPSAVNALDQEAADGYVYVAVETGLDDDNCIEILSGLQEGDTVAYLPTSSGTGTFTMGTMTIAGGMGGAMPGGRPGGGF